MIRSTARGLALVAFCVPSTLAVSAHAGDEPAPRAEGAERKADRANTGTALGFNLQRLHDEFGMGILAATPSFLGDFVRISGGAGVAFYSGSEAPWVTFGTGRLVVEAGRKLESAPIRLYGFGGGAGLLLPDRLASADVRLGGVGGFGFEFFNGPTSYFFEAGGIGTGARANRLASSPTIANGFYLAVGFRGFP